MDLKTASLFTFPLSSPLEGEGTYFIQIHPLKQMAAVFWPSVKRRWLFMPLGPFALTKDLESFTNIT